MLFYPKTVDRWFYFTQYSNGRIIVTRILCWPIFWLKNNLKRINNGSTDKDDCPSRTGQSFQKPDYPKSLYKFGLVEDFAIQNLLFWIREWYAAGLTAHEVRNRLSQLKIIRSPANDSYSFIQETCDEWTVYFELPEDTDRYSKFFKTKFAIPPSSSFKFHWISWKLKNRFEISYKFKLENQNGSHVAGIRLYLKWVRLVEWGSLVGVGSCNNFIFK